MIDEEHIQIIKEAVGDKFGIAICLMESKTRKREVVIARQTAMSIMYEILKGMSLKNIGAEFGNRDHSTVIHANITVSDMKDTDSLYRKIFTGLLEYCRIKIEKPEDAPKLPPPAESNPVDKELKHLVVSERQMMDYSKNSTPVNQR